MHTKKQQKNNNTKTKNKKQKSLCVSAVVMTEMDDPSTTDDYGGDVTEWA